MLLTLIIIKQMMFGNNRQLSGQAAACLELGFQLLEESFTVPPGDGHEQILFIFEIQIHRAFGNACTFRYFRNLRFVEAA
ncbi:hypothetical protein D3C73_606280 [compost metagenome]